MSRRALFAIGTATALGVAAILSTASVAQFNPWNNNNVNMRSLTDNWGHQARSERLPATRASTSI
jgi:hypothetical protein